MRVHPNAHTEPAKNIIPVDTMMLPIPTRGETMPPNANPNAHSRADAVPALARSLSMANVLEAVKVSPSMESNPRSSSSYTQKLQPAHRARQRKNETMTMPMLPLYKACSGWSNLTAEVADSIIAIALTPEQMLNANGEKP